MENSGPRISARGRQEVPEQARNRGEVRDEVDRDDDFEAAQEGDVGVVSESFNDAPVDTVV